MRFLTLLAFCFFCLSSYARAEAVVGQAAPALVTPMLDGKNFDLSTLKGKVVLIHFWATWCAPCREEMPIIEAIWRKYHSKGLEVLAISADRPRAKKDVNEVMHIFTFPAAMMDSITKNDFGSVSSIPVTYIVGSSGKLEDMLTPDTKPLNEASLDDEIKSLLTKPAEVKAPPSPDTKTAAPAETKPEETKPVETK